MLIIEWTAISIIYFYWIIKTNICLIVFTVKRSYRETQTLFIY